MFRYMALSWNAQSSRDATALQAVQHALRTHLPTWRTVFVQRGLVVYCPEIRRETGELYALDHDAGVLLGTVFERVPATSEDDVMRRAKLGPEESANIISTGGRRLVDFYWGCYVAFLYAAASETTYVLRGPMSDLPCLSTTYHGVTIYFSRMEDAIQLKLLRFSINWPYVRAYVAFKDPRTRETALNEVTTILVGECVERTESRVAKHFYWHPCEVSRSGLIDDPVAAQRLLRLTARLCTDAWASLHEAVLHRLSGGLDSSIVLSCLRGAASSPRVTCLNLYSRTPLGDERRFAQAMAQLTSCELVERERRSDLSLQVLRDIRMTSRPMRDFTAYESHGPEVQLARERGATAIFCGELGDAVFEQATAKMAAADFLWRKGFRPALLRVASNVAQYGNVSVLKVLHQAITSRWTAAPGHFWSDNLYGLSTGLDANRLTTPGELMTEEAFEEAKRTIERFVHPWLWFVDGIPASKLWLVSFLTPDACSDGPFLGLGDPPIIAPLSSQPLVELALRIPTYLSVDKGWDRAVARKAFAEDLPSEIATRTTKGSPALWLRELVRNNRSFLRDFLIDGALVDQRILDRKKLEMALIEAPTKSVSSDAVIVRLLYTEAWVRGWTREESRVAARADIPGAPCSQCGRS